jgi:copper chaperone CopZ
MTTTGRSVLLALSAIRCPRCAAEVAHALYAVPGVAVARVAVATREASVDYDPLRTTPSALMAAVRSVGFDVVGGDARHSASLAAQPHGPPEMHHVPEAPAGPWYPEIQLVLGIMFGVAGFLLVLEHGSHLIGAWVVLLLSGGLVGHFFMRRWRG